MTRQEALTRYAEAFETLTPDRLEDLGRLVSDDVLFRDPFNETYGRADFLKVFEDMYRQTQAPSFEVRDTAMGARAGYIRWDMTFRRGGRDWRFEGVSEIQFDAQGRVAAHLDHWDSGSQLYAKIPLVGAVINLIRRRLAV